MKARGSTDRRGFTFIEVVLAALIVALLAALTMPLLGQGARSFGMRTAHYELVSLLRQARYTAAATGKTCIVRLRPASGGYLAEPLIVENEGEPPVPIRQAWATQVQLPAVQELLQIPPDRGRSDRTELTIRFTPMGVTEDYVVELDTPDGQTARIEIRRPSGLVRLVSARRSGVLTERQDQQIERYWREHFDRVMP